MSSDARLGNSKSSTRDAADDNAGIALPAAHRMRGTWRGRGHTGRASVPGPEDSARFRGADDPRASILRHWWIGDRVGCMSPSGMFLPPATEQRGYNVSGARSVMRRREGWESEGVASKPGKKSQSAPAGWPTSPLRSPHHRCREPFCTSHRKRKKQTRLDQLQEQRRFAKLIHLAQIRLQQDAALLIQHPLSCRAASSSLPTSNAVWRQVLVDVPRCGGGD